MCLDTYPPIFYMNETSKEIIRIITLLNKGSLNNKCAYSIDAGFHVFLFFLKDDKEMIEKYIIHNEDIKVRIDNFIMTSIGRSGVEIMQ